MTRKSKFKLKDKKVAQGSANGNNGLDVVAQDAPTVTATESTQQKSIVNGNGIESPTSPPPPQEPEELDLISFEDPPEPLLPSLNSEIDDYIVPTIVKVVSLAEGGSSLNGFGLGGIDELLLTDDMNGAYGDSFQPETNGSATKKSKRNRRKNKTPTESLIDQNGSGDHGLSHEIPSNSQRNGWSYSGNNIVLISADEYNETSDVPPSCVDNTINALSADDSCSGNEIEMETIIRTSGGGGGALLDLDYDENDSSQKVGSWWLSDDSRRNYRNSSYGETSEFQTCLPTSYIDHNDSSSFDSPPAALSLPFSSSSSNASIEHMTVCSFPGCCQSTVNKCGRCKRIQYCSVSHQQLDWPNHKNDCAPFKIADVGAGSDGDSVSVAVANQNVPAGKLIFEEKPLSVFALADCNSENQLVHPLDLPCVLAQIQKKPYTFSICESTNPSCLGCFRRVSGTSKDMCQCSKCSLPMCSAYCQFLPSHSTGECKEVSSFNASKRGLKSTGNRCYHTMYMDVEILRALRLQTFDNRLYDNFLEMRNYVRVEAYKKTDQFKLFAENVDSLVPISAKCTGYNYDLITNVHAIISCLSFRPSLNTSFKLLFNTQNLFAHDCVPNTLHYIQEESSRDPLKMKLVTKAATEIMKDQIITIDFTPSPYLPYHKRNQILKNLLNVTNCLCQRCTNPNSLIDYTAEIKCPQCEGGSVYPECPRLWSESVWSCRSCQEEISYSWVVSIEEDCRKEMGRLAASPKETAVPRLLEFIKRKGDRELNPQHYLIIMAWSFMESLIRDGLKAERDPDPSRVYNKTTLSDFKALGEYAEVMESHFNSIRPGLWFDKGLILFYKFYATFVQVSREYRESKIDSKEFTTKIFKCVKILQDSLKILQVYEGWNVSSMVNLNQEVTNCLFNVKEYLKYFLKYNSKRGKLPSLGVLMSNQSSN